MFTVNRRIANGFDLVVLSDEGSNTYAEIIPAYGGMLHAFTILHNGEKINVVDSYDDIDDINENLTGKGFKGCKLSPFACRVKNATYHFGQENYTINKFLLGNNALHGLLYDAEFIITEQKATSNHASVTMLHQYDGKAPGYPFAYDCVINYTLAENAKLSVTTTIINKSIGLMPIQDGWHPYFALGDTINELQLEFQSNKKLLFDDQMIPTGATITYQEFGSLKKIGNERFDDCFTVNFAECQPMCVLRNPAKKIQVEVYPDKSYPYLQIYTPDHRGSIAIENLSAAPDAFNNGIGLITLNKEESVSFATAYKITAL